MQGERLRNQRLSHAGERLRDQRLSDHTSVVASLSWPDGHHVPALTVTSGGRGVGFDMHAWGRLDRRALVATSQPSSFFPLFFASFGRRGLFMQLSLRTQAWPAIEFVSGKEGLRPL